VLYTKKTHVCPSKPVLGILVYQENAYARKVRYPTNVGEYVKVMIIDACFDACYRF